MGSLKAPRESVNKQLDEIVLAAFRDIGQILAQARVEQNLTITQVASKIHIRQRYLIDLEEGHLSDLPGRVYILGFIRTYARLLNLDGEELIRRISTLPNLPDYNCQVSIPINPEEEPSYLVLGVSIVLVLMISIGGYFFLRPSSNDISPLMAMTAPDKLSPNQQVALQKDIPDETNEEEHHLEAVSAVLTPEISSVPHPELGPKIIYPKDVLPILPPPTTEDKGAKNQEGLSLKKTITLKASEPSWVEIRDETERVIFMKVLKTGEDYLVPEKPGITINTGNAGGIDIFVGKVKLPPLGTRGEVKRGIRIEDFQ